MTSQDPAPTEHTPEATEHTPEATEHTPEPSSGPARDLDALELIAEPAVIRRAPRFGAFVRAGVLLGAVIGWLISALTPAAAGEPRSAVIALTALGLACLGALVGAGLAVIADRRSGRRRR